LVRRADFSSIAAAGDAPVRTEGTLHVDEPGATDALGLCDSLKVGLSSVLSPLADAFRWAFGDAWLTVMVIGLPLLLIAAWTLARRGPAGRRAPLAFAIADAIDRLNDRIGRFVAWLTLVMVVVTVLIVVLRYGFEIGFIWMQESVRFMHAAVFLLCAGYTLLWNQHVRVDAVHCSAARRHQLTIRGLSPSQPASTSSSRPSAILRRERAMSTWAATYAARRTTGASTSASGWTICGATNRYASPPSPDRSRSSYSCPLQTEPTSHSASSTADVAPSTMMVFRVSSDINHSFHSPQAYRRRAAVG